MALLVARRRKIDEGFRCHNCAKQRQESSSGSANTTRALAFAHVAHARKNVRPCQRGVLGWQLQRMNQLANSPSWDFYRREQVKAHGGRHLCGRQTSADLKTGHRELLPTNYSISGFGNGCHVGPLTSAFFAIPAIRGKLQQHPEVNDFLSYQRKRFLCRKAFGRIANYESPYSFKDGYLGMVDVSHALMRGRTAKQQREAVLQGFPKVPALFRALFPYSKWGAEVNAQITPRFFTWLVGPMDIREEPVNGVLQKSTVHIKKCRYLEESGCTGMCVNLCKMPTQTFFTEQLGMPVTMNPNFEDLSCDMIFGLVPPPLDEDPVSKQPCFATCRSSNLAVKVACKRRNDMKGKKSIKQEHRLETQQMQYVHIYTYNLTRPKA
eukprot:jgi/Mesvir1/14339/Mv09747-RA.1